MKLSRRNIWYEIGHKSRLHAIVAGRAVCGVVGEHRGPLNANLKGQELCGTCCRVLAKTNLNDQHQNLIPPRKDHFCDCCQNEGVVPVMRGKLLLHGRHVVCPLCHGRPSDAQKNYAKMVMQAFDDLEHENRREFLKHKPAVERKARQTF